MKNFLEDIKLNEIWESYNQVRVAGDKKSANKLLLDFIDLLKQQDEKIIKAFVDNILNLTLEAENKIISNNGTEVSEKNIRIQHSLFKEVVLPILKDQYQMSSAKHIKWIGQLEQFFYSDFATTKEFLNELNITEYFETRYFFEKSFAIDKNQNTLKLLLNRIAQDLNHYTHEVLNSVLVYPEVLNKEIMTFREYWQECDSKINWEADLAEWELIAKHWTIFNEVQDKYINFENYLNINGIQL